MFNAAGVTRDSNDVVKVRFATDMAFRIKCFIKGGAKEVEFVELPEPMNKVDACKFLLTVDMFAKNADYKEAIEEQLAKKIKASVVKVPKQAKPKKEKPVAKKEKPVAKKEKPVAKKEKPVAKKEKPVAKKEKPVAKKEKPVAKKEKPKQPAESVKVSMPMTEDEDLDIKEIEDLVASL